MTAVWTLVGVTIGLFLVVGYLLYLLDACHRRYDFLVDKFMLYKASADNPVGAGMMVQANKLRGIANQRPEPAKEPPKKEEKSGITFVTGIRT